MKEIYPNFTVHPNKNPNKFYAIPAIGFLVKFVMLIPVFLWMWVVALGWIILVMFVNPFVVLFTGKYWTKAYEINRAFMMLSVKLNLFLYGITDRYPGFSFEKNEAFNLEIPQPASASRWFAFPVFGLVVRIILLIPYLIYMNVISQAASLGIFLGAWVVVLFKNRYPESMYEFGRDSLRLSLSSTMYMSGLTEKYPSFSISWNHKNIKIALIVLSIIFSIFNYTSESKQTAPLNDTQEDNYQYPESLQLD